MPAIKGEMKDSSVIIRLHYIFTSSGTGDKAETGH